MNLPRMSPEIWFPLTALLFVGVIFLIYRTLASDDQARCVLDDPSLKAIILAKTPTAVPEIRLTKDDDSHIQLADFEGHGVILNFWATWCAPCVREMPELDALKKTLKNDGIEVLTVSTDREGIPAIREFFARNAISNLQPLSDAKGEAARALGIRGLPTTLIINADGLEVARIVGIHDYASAASAAYFRRCIGKEKS